ncbi:MAG: MFS transporter [Gammaproteobacteria bacterium]|nr:MFS transporter [Gammaproteobacteria bacterium]
MKAANQFLQLRLHQFLLLMAAVFTVYVGYGIVLPVLPFMLERVLGDGARFSVAWHTGMIAGVYMLAVFVFAPLWGRASDLVGRRPVILLGLGGCVLALATFGLATNLWLAYLSRGLGGALVSAVLPVTLAYVSDTSVREVRARRFAWMTAATTLGFLVGPLLGGWLTGTQVSVPMGDSVGGSFSAPFFTAAAAGAVIWLAVWRWLPSISSSPGEATRPQGVRNASSVTVLLLLALLGMFGLGVFEVAIALQGKQVLGLNPLQIGLIFLECSLVMVAVQVLVFSPLVRRVGFRFIIVPAFLAMVAGVGLLPAVVDMDWIMVLVGLFAAGSGILIPMLAYRVSLDAGTAQGAALGRQTAAASLGQGLGSVAAGGLYGIAIEAPFWLTAVLLLAGALLGLAFSRRVPVTAE